MNTEDRKNIGGCCGCFLVPSVFALFAGGLVWFAGFTTALLFHGIALMVWAATHAVGHVLFGWPVPKLPPDVGKVRRIER